MTGAVVGRWATCPPDSGTCTPNWYAPVVACPSTAESTRHFTVYTPRASGRTGTTSVSGSPGDSSGRPVWYVLPRPSATMIDDSAETGRSDSDSVTSVGAAPNVAPAAGSELSNPA